MKFDKTSGWDRTEGGPSGSALSPRRDRPPHQQNSGRAGIRSIRASKALLFAARFSLEAVAHRSYYLLKSCRDGIIPP